MPKKRDPFKLGITVIVMFILFFFFLLFISERRLFKTEETVFIVRFFPGSVMPEITKGSFVTYFGQTVGKVIDTRIVKDVDPRNPQISDQQFLEVQTILQAGLGLREDCKIVATGPPLGGKGTLAIISRGISSVPVSPDTPVYGQMAGFQAALDQITREFDEQNPEGLLSAIKLQLNSDDRRSLVYKSHQSIDNIKALTASLETELNREHKDAALFKIHASLDQLYQGLAEVAALVKENRPKIDRTVASVDSAATKLDQDVIGVLAEEFEIEEKPEVNLRAKIHDAFDCLNQSLADINVVTEETKETVIMNKDRISEVVENAADASMHLRQGIKDLKLHPWKLLFQPSDAEKRELHLYNVAREFVEAAAHLDDATSRLKALLEAKEGQISINDPDLADIRFDLKTTVERFIEAEEALWQQLNTK